MKALDSFSNTVKENPITSVVVTALVAGGIGYAVAKSTEDEEDEEDDDKKKSSKKEESKKDKEEED